DTKRRGVHSPRLNPPHVAKALLVKRNFSDGHLAIQQSARAIFFGKNCRRLFSQLICYSAWSPRSREYRFRFAALLPRQALFSVTRQPFSRSSVQRIKFVTNLIRSQGIFTKKPFHIK
ncbi:hypothetical protein, partial [Rhodoblastus acidophilus]|uniref:hypothetical protein n=1 Tax=Rhodoblastus acidophilus TaxID=1074 RepID=UPI00222413F2